jgi:hypothetical protein
MTLSSDLSFRSEMPVNAMSATASNVRLSVPTPSDAGRGVVLVEAQWCYDTFKLVYIIHHPSQNIYFGLSYTFS